MTTNSDECLACLRGLTGECQHGSNTKQTGQRTDTEGKDSEIISESKVGSEGYAYDPRGYGTSGPYQSDTKDDESGTTREDSEPGTGKRKRRNKRDAALRDQQSTGRKRAARLYPLDRDAECEWAGSTSAGGGTNPIPGCGKRRNTVKGKQQARHHGPDKNTLNNEPGNVHRICHSCHNAWHAVNDPDYVWGTKVKGD
jgi:hypothetical protein